MFDKLTLKLTDAYNNNVLSFIMQHHLNIEDGDDENRFTEPEFEKLKLALTQYKTLQNEGKLLHLCSY